jgi:NTE family protein
MASVDAQVTGMVSRVVVVSPDKDSKVAIGRNVLDPAARAPSARAGRAQAATVAAQIADVWNG